METWFPSFVAGFSAVLVAVIEARAAKERKQDKRDRDESEKQRMKSKAVEDGVLALLRDRIIERYNHYMDQEYIPIYGMENVLAMYSAYHALGGNGTVTGLVNDLKALPHELPEKE